MKYFIDVDGVIADYTVHVSRLFGKPEYKGHSYDIAGAWGMSQEEFTEPQDTEFWRTMPRTPWADDLMALFVNRSSSLLTASPVESHVGRKQWVAENYPQYQYYLIFAECKEEMAHRGVTLIDDHERNVDKFRCCGGHAILFPRPWNRLRQLSDDPMKYVEGKL